MKTALISGVSGQDGAYLAQLLLGKGYRVVGASRDADNNDFLNLRKLGIKSDIELVSMELTDSSSVMQLLHQVKPDEVYNLAGQSSVGLSFDQPHEAFESVSIGTLNLLEAIRFASWPIRLYNAGSGESFGNTNGEAASELTPFHPRSPYGIAKTTAYWLVSTYRESHDLFACTGIMFNHESPLRPERFVTRKIVATACRIANGAKENLTLGNLDIKRDWGWAPEYVVAMWKMLQQDSPEDFVIATGRNYGLRDFVVAAFDTLGLDVDEHLVTNPGLRRPLDIRENRGDASKAHELLGWEASVYMKGVVELMVESEMKQYDSLDPH